jgi:ABC-type phosphate transport system substrate-binding protein
MTMTARTKARDTAFRRRRCASVTACVVALALAIWSFAAQFTPPVCADPATATFKIIVHPNNPVRSMSQDFLAQAFFKQTMRWDTGQTIEPVDLPLSAPARQAFSTHVLKRSVPAVRAYWLQRIFSGRQVPPLELDSDAAVVRFVAGAPGAVGYVSSAADTGNAKVVPVQ